MLRGTSPRWLGQQNINTNQLQKLININTNQQQKINIDQTRKKNRNVCSLTNKMIKDFHQMSKYNLNNSAQKPDTRTKRRISHPGICHKLLRKPGRNLNKDGMTSLYLI